MARTTAGLLVGCFMAALLPVLAQGAEGPVARTVSVSGAAEVSARPDLARVLLGVEARKPTLPAARSEVASVIDRLLALTRELKIDPRFVNATGLQVRPEYTWDNKDRKRVLLGYLVSREVQVEVHDLEQLGVLLERAVDSGANQVSDPLLDSSRRKDLEREALAKAAQDARLSAETLARAAGAQLGAVRSLSASGNASVVPVFRRSPGMMATAAAAPAETYQTGDMKFSATVNVEYDLVGP